MTRAISVCMAALAAMLFVPSLARADACSDAVDRSNAARSDDLKEFTRTFTMGTFDKAENAQYFCSRWRKTYENEQRHLSSMKRLEKICGSRLRTNCGSACIEAKLPDLREKYTTSCAEAARLNQPLEKLRSACLEGVSGISNDDDNVRLDVCGKLASATGADPQVRAQAYLRVASLHASKKDDDKELQAYNEALRVNPGNENALIGRGLFYMIKDKSDLALKDFSDGIAANPRSAMLRMHRARIYETRSDNDAAIADLSEAIRLNPADEMIDMLYDQRAMQYIYKGDYDRAIAEYKALARRGESGKMMAEMGMEQVKSWQRIRAGKAKPK